MSLPRKRRAGASKPSSTRTKSLKSTGTECGTGVPADVLPQTLANRTPRTQSSLAKEAEPEGQPWRRSPRLQGLSLASSPEGLIQSDRDQAESPSGGHAEGQKDEQDLTVDEVRGGAGLQVGKRRGGGRRRRAPALGRDDPPSSRERQGEEQPELEIDSELDRDLENKSRQHKLTSANVRSIIHEVITNEHVVAMMKAAINETEPVPVFEPTMTRSKLKEVVERGAVIPTWNISPIKKHREAKTQFVDIPLEDEDSSGEEYCPDEDDEDETAEETLLESDLESTSSSPRGGRSVHRVHDEDRHSGSYQRSRHLRVEVVPMGPPPPPQPCPGPAAPPRTVTESSFMEKLYAVDEELAISSHCIEPYQALGGGGAVGGQMAFRTRSKRPLRDVPMEELEAELRSPDFTPDVPRAGSALEDREWTHWLQGLMTSAMNNEEEADDDDDPEYNFLADTDEHEPDVEDYRNDRAVRITKKEVNELMEELFDTFQGVQEEEEAHEEEEEEREEDKDEEDAPPAPPPSVSILHTVQYENPLADVLNESYRTVREHLAALRRRRALLESRGIAWPPPSSEPPPPPLLLSHTQKIHLQQQVQQHVQLLTQVTMLCSPVERLKTEASIARQFLSELEVFAQRGEQVRRAQDSTFSSSIFRASNLQGALSLLEELSHYTPPEPTPHPTPIHSVLKKPASGRRFPMIPPHQAWLMATRPAFIYPELLPHVSLDPAHHPSSAHKIKNFTPGEDCLIVLGHRHFSETPRPLKMAAHYLLAAKTVTEINKHVYDVCHRLPNHVISSYFQQKRVPSMPQPCRRVEPSDQRPPVERDENIMPLWLWKSLQGIYKAVLHHSGQQGASFPRESVPRSSASDRANPSGDDPCPKTLLPPPPPRPYSFPPGVRYPPSLPERLVMQPCGLKWVPPPPPARHPPGAPAKPSPRPPKRRERLFTPTWRQEGKLLQPIQPAPAPAPPPPSHTPPLTPPPAPSAPPGRCVRGRGGASACVRGRGGASACVRGRGGASACVRGRGGPVLGLGGVIISLPVSSPLVCPMVRVLNPPPLVTPAPGLAPPLTPQATPLGESLVSQQHCDTLIGRHKLLAPPLPQLVLVRPPTVRMDHSHSGGKRMTSRRHTEEEEDEEEEEEEEEDNATEERDDEETIERLSWLAWKGRCDAEKRSGQEKSLKKKTSATSDCQRAPPPGDRRNDEPEVGCEEAPVSLSADEAPVSLSGDAGLEVSLSVDEAPVSLSGDAGLEVSLSVDEAPVSLSADAGLEVSLSVDEAPVSLSADAGLDDDPRKETKDVAFAQAYLQKVCEALQEDPGKVEEFLGVLKACEREDRTAVELYQRLRPLLQHWPDLLQDFSAFLQPEQANQCGLLAEQRAFERSRRFLRRLELSFGESSALYRQVVRILRGGANHRGITEVKGQISTVLGSHAHLLEEFWVFFHRLHPQVSDTESERQQSQPIRSNIHSQEAEHLNVLPHSVGSRRLVAPENMGPGDPRESSTGDPPGDPNRRQGGGDTAPDPETVCAKNISLMPSGERVVLWTREADRAILTACQQQGANQRTFCAVSAQLGNKTANEVSVRFHDLMRLFHTSSSRQRHSSEDDSDSDTSTSTSTSASSKEQEPD